MKFVSNFISKTDHKANIKNQNAKGVEFTVNVYVGVLYFLLYELKVLKVKNNLLYPTSLMFDALRFSYVIKVIENSQFYSRIIHENAL